MVVEKDSVFPRTSTRYVLETRSTNEISGPEGSEKCEYFLDVTCRSHKPNDGTQVSVLG